MSDDFIEQMKEYCLKEDQCLWDMGDLLAKVPLTDDDVEKLGEIVGRSSKTLREREDTAREFPPNKRDTRHAHGVYVALLRIKGKNASDARMQLLDSRNEWTVKAMNKAITNYIEQGTIDNPAQKAPQTSVGMSVGDIKVRGKLMRDGKIQLVVEGSFEDPQVMNPGGEVLIYLTPSE